MSNKYTSLTMSLAVNNESITVYYNKEFIFPLMLFMPALFGMLLYLYAFPVFIKWVLIFLFVTCLSGLIAHLKTFFSGEDVFFWKVDCAGFYFQAHRTNLFSLKPPVFYSWSIIEKVIYVKKYITLDHESDKVTFKNVVLIFGIGRNEPKIIDCPHRKRVSFELFKVMDVFAPHDTNFELLENYDDSIMQ